MHLPDETDEINYKDYDDIKVPFEKVEAVTIKETLTLKQLQELYPEIDIRNSPTTY